MRYYAKVRKSEGVYLVTFPDLPSVNTYGETLPEALRNAAEALNGALESDFERGFRLVAPMEHKGRSVHAVQVAPHLAVAYALRALRNGRTQGEIARKLGVSYQNYAKLENPRRCNPRIRTLEKVAEALGKRVEVAFV
jgi:antitoxin HicB